MCACECVWWLQQSFIKSHHKHTKHCTLYKDIMQCIQSITTVSYCINISRIKSSKTTYKHSIFPFTSSSLGQHLSTQFKPEWPTIPAWYKMPGKNHEANILTRSCMRLNVLKDLQYFSKALWWIVWCLSLSFHIVGTCSCKTILYMKGRVRLRTAK